MYLVTLLGEGDEGSRWDAWCLFRRVACGALVQAVRRCSAKALDSPQNAVGRLAALESFARGVQVAIKTKRSAAVALFDCSSAFSHADRALILTPPQMMTLEGPSWEAMWPFLDGPAILQMHATAQELNDATKYGPLRVILLPDAP